jgi:MFS family permease
VLHASREFLLSALIAACGLAFFVIPFSGYLSDRIGRKRMYMIGAVATGIFGFVYFAMLNSLVPALMFLAVMLSFVPHGLIFGPQAALFAECFTPRLR